MDGFDSGIGSVGNRGRAGGGEEIWGYCGVIFPGVILLFLNNDRGIGIFLFLM
jgi:hypothetical protein